QVQLLRNRQEKVLSAQSVIVKNTVSLPQSTDLFRFQAAIRSDFAPQGLTWDQQNVRYIVRCESKKAGVLIHKRGFGAARRVVGLDPDHLTKGFQPPPRAEFSSGLLVVCYEKRHMFFPKSITNEPIIERCDRNLIGWEHSLLVSGYGT